MFRATVNASDALPAPLRPALPIGAAGFVRYLDGAVGPYDEVFAVPSLVRGRPLRAHVPFMAVDSLASVHGGRTNWALPKVLARFTGSPADGADLSAEGDDWRVVAGVRRHGPRLPWFLAGPTAQVWPDGMVRAFRATLRGRARLATIDVAVEGPSSLTDWLPSGRHRGLVLRGVGVFHPPRLVQRSSAG